MGLAASQARLLTITARKADCEFASMTLSHQKLALSRDMENVSNDYQNALSQTKLVYDYYGTGDTTMALDYDLLMTPSVYNDYYPKTVTDANNRIILNSQLAAAARAAGIPAEGLEGTPSSNVRNTFIEALAGAGVITPAKAAAIQAVTYGNTLGLGSTTNVTYGYVDLTYEELLDMLTVSGTYSETLGLSSNVIESGASANERSQLLFTIDSNGNRTRVDQSTGMSVSLVDLLSNDMEYVIGYDSKLNAYAIDGAAQLQTDILGSDGEGGILDWILGEFSAVLGGTASNDSALQYAYNAIYDLLYPNSDLRDKAALNDGHGNGGGSGNDEFMDTVGTKVGTTKNKERFQDDLANKAGDYIGMVYYGNKAKKWMSSRDNDGSCVAISLNNIAQVFLTAYVDYLTGLEEGYSYNKGILSSSILYDPNQSDFTFTIAGQTEVESDEDNLYANFYDSLFNQICMNGWTENSQIENVEYMTDLFKNGLAFISSIAEDGYYYQGSYSTDRAILEVSDENAIAVAEAKYNTEKTKIENKEDTIDMKMKNLDTEISSLTTEYESTKQIISKAIEKSFKRYEA